MKGSVLWSYESELLNRDSISDVAAHFSGAPPFHAHSGTILLLDRTLQIDGDEFLEISFEDIVQLYLGFDDIFPVTLAKNFGLFWQPLRLTLSNGRNIYLIIDYNFFGTKNKKWFKKLREVLS